MLRLRPIHCPHSSTEVEKTVTAKAPNTPSTHFMGTGHPLGGKEEDKPPISQSEQRDCIVRQRLQMLFVQGTALRIQELIESMQIDAPSIELQEWIEAFSQIDINDQEGQAIAIAVLIHNNIPPSSEHAIKWKDQACEILQILLGSQSVESFLIEIKHGLNEKRNLQRISSVLSSVTQMLVLMDQTAFDQHNATLMMIQNQLLTLAAARQTDRQKIRREIERIGRHLNEIVLQIERHLQTSVDQRQQNEAQRVYFDTILNQAHTLAKEL